MISVAKLVLHLAGYPGNLTQLSTSLFALGNTMDTISPIPTHTDPATYCKFISSPSKSAL